MGPIAHWYSIKKGKNEISEQPQSNVCSVWFNVSMEVQTQFQGNHTSHCQRLGIWEKTEFWIPGMRWNYRHNSGLLNLGTFLSL